MDIAGLYKIISDTLVLPEDFVFKANIRPSFVPGWDSLNWIKIVTNIENEIDLELPLDIFSELGTVEEFCESILNFMSEQ